MGAELAANATFAHSAISAFFDDGNPLDLAAAVFIGIGESGLDVVSAGVSFVGQEIVNVGHALSHIFSNFIHHGNHYDSNDTDFNDNSSGDNFFDDNNLSNYAVSITLGVGYAH